ncbi:MAG TPA: ABATE domain-containing protein [Candidatus Binataceae bacterium]|nr:ABATE domain-containing protein [Candidatus Binataceae bacterium]
MTNLQRIGRAGALVLAPRRDLCLDFVNTLAWRGSAPSESLHGLPDLVQWCACSGGLLAGAIESGGAWAERHPARAAAIFRGAIALRETICRIFHALAGGGAPADGDLSELNRALKETPARSALQRIDGGFGWRVEGTRLVTAPALLAPALWSAGDLLTGPQLARVRECANDKCLWLFLDESKNGTRRWCSMSACGNRAKAHRHYARLKGG